MARLPGFWWLDPRTPSTPSIRADAAMPYEWLPAGVTLRQLDHVAHCRTARQRTARQPTGRGNGQRHRASALLHITEMTSSGIPPPASRRGSSRFSFVQQHSDIAAGCT